MLFRTPPVAPRLEPEGRLAQLRFLLRGRGLLQSTLRRLAATPPGASAQSRADAQRMAASALMQHLDVRLQVGGLHHVGRGPFVIVALHEGVLDALCLALLPLTLRCAVREEIFDWPEFGPAITALAHLPIDPERGAASYRRLLRAARLCVARGESIAMFPQGTLLGVETAFRAGAFHLAQALRLPILPVMLSGTHRVWEYPFTPTLRYAQRVAMAVLPPMSSSAGSPEMLRTAAQHALKRAALQQQWAAPRRFDPPRDGWWDGFSFEIDPQFGALRAQHDAHRTSMAASIQGSTRAVELARAGS